MAFFSPGVLKTIDRELLNYASNWGEYRKNYICIRLYLISSLILSFDSIYRIYEGLFFNAFISFSQAVLYTILIGMFYRGKMLLAKDITFALTNVFMFINGSLYGREAYQHLIMMPLIIASVFFYADKEFRHMITALIVTIVNLIMLELTDYSLLKGIFCFSNPFAGGKMIIVLLTAAFSFYSLFELLRMNASMEEKLKKLNGSLQIRNSRLKRSNEDLDSFVYRASHDLRAPLASIMGVINIVKTEKEIVKVKDYMKYQERSVKKLDDLIQDILDISRNARLDLSIEAIDLHAFIKSCVESYSFMEESKHVKIEVVVPEGFILHTDARRLKVIVNNLLSNALRYYDPSKTNAFVRISIENRFREVVVIVQDNGVGIEPTHLNKVFEMFYRANSTVSGSGLGLYIVKDAVEKLDGVVKLSSVLGEGTTVELILPRLDQRSEKGIKSSATDDKA